MESITSRLYLSSTFCAAEINEGYPASENGKLAALTSGRPAFQPHDLNAALQYASHILHIGDAVFFGTKAAYLNEFSQAWQKGGEVK